MGASIGIYGKRMKAEISLPLGQYIAISQAEILAISACAQQNLRRGYSNKHIYICCDIQGARKALSAYRVKSAVTLECMNTLERLAESNRVKLIWVPGHQGVRGNERADWLAREGSMTTLIGPQPTTGIALESVKAKVRV